MKVKILLLLVFLAISCSENLPKISTKDGFEKVRLNMDIYDFTSEYGVSETKSMTAYPNGNFKMVFDSLAISNEVTLKSVNLMFYQNKLGQITVDSSDEIFNILKNQNGIIREFTDNSGKRKVVFSTELDKVKCIYEKSPNQKGKIVFYVSK